MGDSRMGRDGVSVARTTGRNASRKPADGARSAAIARAVFDGSSAVQWLLSAAKKNSGRQENEVRGALARAETAVGEP